MGTDIHIYFEKQTDDGWVPYPHAPELDPKYWWERIVSNPQEQEKALVAFGLENPKDSKSEIYEKLSEFCENLPLSEAERLYGENPLTIREWSYDYSLRRRNYDFFASLSGIRLWGEDGSVHQPEPLGIPEDCCREIRWQHELEKEDSHTESWIMVSELVNDPNLKDFENVKNIAKFLEGEDLSKIRMVFWYDN